MRSQARTRVKALQAPPTFKLYAGLGKERRDENNYVGDQSDKIWQLMGS
jgi:hypothetical protein